MGFVTLFATLAIATSALGADLYHHELIQYPRSESCDITAAELAKRFSDASGAEIYWAGSTKEGSTTCDIKISYIADKEVELTRTVDRSGMGGFRKGTKRTLAECTADLQREKTLFKKSTGLDSWTAYCYQESNFLNAFPFVPVVEGIGKPDLSFFSSDHVFSVAPNVGWASMLTAVWKTAAEHGLHVASVTVRPYVSADNQQVTIRYYAKERLYLQADGIAEHRSPAICDSQVEEIRVGLEKAERPPIGVYCGKYGHGQYRLAIVTLSTNVFGSADLRAIEDSKHFSSLSSCRADLPTTLDFYRKKLGKKILAGICANGGGEAFRITAIEERKSAPGPKLLRR